VREGKDLGARREGVGGGAELKGIGLGEGGGDLGFELCAGSLFSYGLIAGFGGVGSVLRLGGFWKDRQCGLHREHSFSRGS